MSCGQAHSSAREFVAQGNETKLVAETRHISRSSLYYQAKPRRQSCGSLARFRRSSLPAAKSRPTDIVAWSGGWAASRTGGQCYIARFHRSLKEEDVWLNEYQNFDHAKPSITRWIEEYSHDRPASRSPGQNAARIPCPVPCSNPYFKHGPLCLV